MSLFNGTYPLTFPLNTERAYKWRLSGSARPSQLKYSALIGLFAQACRTPAKFQATAQGKVFRLFAFFVKRSANTTRNVSTEEEFRQVSYFISMHFNF